MISVFMKPYPGFSHPCCGSRGRWVNQPDSWGADTVHTGDIGFIEVHMKFHFPQILCQQKQLRCLEAGGEGSRGRQRRMTEPEDGRSWNLAAEQQALREAGWAVRTDRLGPEVLEGAGIAPEIADPRKFPAPLDPGSVHQGAALEVRMIGKDTFRTSSAVWTVI